MANQRSGSTQVGSHALFLAKHQSNLPRSSTMAITDNPGGRSCFIAAPIDADVSAVVSSLVRMGIKCNRADWFDSGITPTALKDAIRHSDFVCVFCPVAPPPNLWFEIGLAIGLGKSIFMVAQQDFLLYSASGQTSFVGATEWKAEVVDPHLEAFLSTLPAKRSPGRKGKHHSFRRVTFAAERAEMEAFAKKRESSEADLELFIEALFRKAGLNVTTAPLEDFGADMAVWSPAINRQFGDPILVEIKSSNMADHRWAIERLSALIKRGRGSVGVYVTISPVGPETALRSQISERHTPILLVTVTQLIDLLETNGFVDSVAATRNRTLGHGI